VPSILKWTLVILLVLRAVAAPVGLRPANSHSSHHRSYVIRMRCWPPQRLQRFSATSKLLRLCVGKNKVASRETHRFLTRRPPVSASHSRLASPNPNAFRVWATNRLTVCLRC
jgi:hypothetical protein